MSEAVRVVRVEVIPATGYVLEIQGAEPRMIVAADAEEDIGRVLDDEVRTALGIPEDVSLTVVADLPPELA
ncbi:hypothetical protein [Kitasatospora purpeofusca]|uniref:hypothetical protein n=1 Tax=Kitasatospora purpeofusca TaxID=67352 RepID=UPI00366941A6